MIQTQRCLLRLAQEKDVDSITHFYQNNAVFLKPWEPKSSKNSLTKDYWQEKVGQHLKEHAEGKSMRLLIMQHDLENVLGFINFTNFESEPFLNCRVGYKLGKSYQGQGYMHEALKAAIAYLFHETQIRRIEANYMPHNQRSGNLLNRLGFKVHGVAPRYLQINGQWEDHCLSSLLKEDFLS